MLLNRARLSAVLAAEGVDAVVLTTPANLVYGADYGSEFLLGRFEDHPPPSSSPPIRPGRRC